MISHHGLEQKKRARSMAMDTSPDYETREIEEIKLGMGQD